MTKRARLAVLFAVVVVLFAGSELALRAAGFGRGIRYRPHPVLGWELEPRQNAFNVRGRAHVRVNALGFRGPDVPVPRPPSTLRLLFLGDGATLNNQTAEPKSYPPTVPWTWWWAR
jgi:hypothetical protein